jgi:hypothetical protein
VFGLTHLSGVEKPRGRAESGMCQPNNQKIFFFSYFPYFLKNISEMAGDEVMGQGTTGSGGRVVLVRESITERERGGGKGGGEIINLWGKEHRQGEENFFLRGVRKVSKGLYV